MASCTRPREPRASLAEVSAALREGIWALLAPLVVLGGIYQQQMTNTTSKVPVFGDIPYLGNLFKRRNDFNEKTELLIFVTPKILTESL